MNRRKISLSAMLMLLAVSLTSCEKEYTCECTLRLQFPKYTETKSYTSKQFLKRDAKEWCDNKEESAGVDEVQCHLK